MRKKTCISIRKWVDVSYEEMVEKHIEIINNQRPLNCDKVMVCLGNPEKPIYENPKQKGVNKTKLLPKYMFLCHTIITRCTGNGAEYSDTFEAKILLSVIGNDYKIMLKVLCKLGLIYTDNSFVEGKSSRCYTMLNRKYVTEKTERVDIIKYRDKMNKLLDHKYRIKLPMSIRAKYRKSLSYLKLDTEMALNYVQDKYGGKYRITKIGNGINNRVEATEEQIEEMKQYRIGRIYDFDNTDEPRMDSNCRIYHCLTNMPRDLLFCTNIKFEMDCSNCHPLLYVNELVKYYKITDEMMLTIAENNPYSNPSNSLVSTDFINQKSDIPSDVIEYIQVTSAGKFWDKALEKYNMTPDERAYIKPIYFAEVFYSYNNSLVRRRKEGRYYIYDGCKECAADFQKSYPNVWECLGKIKEEAIIRLKEEKAHIDELHNSIINEVLKECSLGSYKSPNEHIEIKNNALPNMLMSFEAKLFHEILKRCYQAGIEAISIHDAIVIINTKKNAWVEPEYVRSIIAQVFAENNLYPRIKTEIPECDINSLALRVDK